MCISGIHADGCQGRTVCKGAIGNIFHLRRDDDIRQLVCMGKGFCLNLLQTHEIAEFLEALQVAATKDSTYTIHSCRINACHLRSVGINPSLLTCYFYQGFICLEGRNDLHFHFWCVVIIGRTHHIDSQKTQGKDSKCC